MEETATEKLSPIKRALIEIRELRRKLEAQEAEKTEPLAIVGIGCRVPGGVRDLDSFWHLLETGADAITEIPKDRWDVDLYYDPDYDTPGKMVTRQGGFIEGVDLFDADFFGISPRETVTIDPQQRILLEVAWESLENAGIAPDSLYGSQTGVFIGISTFDYGLLHFRDVAVEKIDAYMATGMTHNAASGRLSYILGLQGPSMSIDTACSSSLVAIHQACQSLRSRECDLALAGGVNVILTPELHINFSRSHILAKDGRCKAFDAAADGFSRGEGCGVLVLKRLSDAVAENDRIHGVIRGSAVNQDGRSSGLTVPNGPSQQAVIKKAIANAGIEPSQIQYIEAHGTGTNSGDPIEVQALAAVFEKEKSKEDPLLIGSVKTNIGHLETAAGVVGLIKLVLSIQHNKIPPHLHFVCPNPHIPWETIPVVVPADGCPWPNTALSRIAGVSSFGFSGTNAHVIIEEAPDNSTGEKRNERPMHLVTLSAQNDEALHQQAIRLTKHLCMEPAAELGDVAFTTNCGRSHFPKRLALISDAIDQVRSRLEAYAKGDTPSDMLISQTPCTESPDIVFMFTGQGAQSVGMAAQFYETQPVFREALELCAEHLRQHLDHPLLSILYPADGHSDLLNQTAYTQPALFALEYALYQLWRSWGINASAVIGHSVGEYVAACVAGMFSLEEGLAMIAERGRLMQSQPEGGMMASVFADEDRVRSMIANQNAAISIAAVNSPTNTVISGAQDSIETAIEQFQNMGIRSSRLVVSHAFHSHLMDPMLDEFEAFADKINYQAPSIPLVSNLSGTFFEHSRDGNARYWRRHVRGAVRFADGIRTLHSHGYRLFLEVGPNPTLCGLGMQCLEEQPALWMPSLRRGRKDWQQMLESLGNLYINGAQVNWEAFNRPFDYQKISLPTYPFQRERYWIDRRCETPPKISTEPDSRNTDALQTRTEQDAATEDVVDRFWNAPKIDRLEIMTEFTRSMVRYVLRKDASKPIGGKVRLMDFGVDSLMAVELRTLLKNGLRLEIDLPATLIFDFPTIEDIANFLMENLQSGTDAFSNKPPTDTEINGTGNDLILLSENPDIEDLDEDAMERLLNARLDRLEAEN